MEERERVREKKREMYSVNTMTLLNEKKNSYRIPFELLTSVKVKRVKSQHVLLALLEGDTGRE